MRIVRNRAILLASLMGINGFWLGASEASPSSPSTKTRDTFRGIRLGAEGIIVQSETKAKSWVNTVTSDNLTVSGWNIAGGVRADAGHFFGGVYLGFNLEWAKGMGAHSAKTADQTANGMNYKIQQRYMMAGSAKIGGLWQECVLYYAKAGIVKGEWDVRASYNNLIDTARNEKPLWGVILGVGVEHVLSERWTVGLELDHQRYNTMTFEREGAVTNYRWKINPASNRILLSFNYKLF